METYSIIEYQDFNWETYKNLNPYLYVIGLRTKEEYEKDYLQEGRYLGRHYKNEQKVSPHTFHILIATIGMQMNIMAIFNKPGILIVGLVWILIHVIVIFIVAKLTKTPFFFLAVGSMANIGGPASAPVIASAFHPSLAPIGVLLAVFGYVIGTYGAYVCGLMMQAVSP